MPTSKIFLGLDRRSDSNLLMYGGAVVAGTKDNKALGTTWGDPSLNWEVFNGSFIIFRDAYYAALSHDKLKIALRNDAHDAFCSVFKRVAAYAEFTANGDTTILLGAGFELRQETTRSPSTEPPGPLMDLRGNPTEHSGRIEMHATKLDDALGYELQICTSDPSLSDAPPWLHKQTVFSVQRFLVDGLAQGFVWLRMRGANHNGYGPWSNPIRVLVL